MIGSPDTTPLAEHYVRLATICESWSYNARSDAEADYYWQVSETLRDLADALDCPIHGLRAMGLLA